MRRVIRPLVCAVACVVVLAPGRAFAQGAQLRHDQFDALGIANRELDRVEEKYSEDLAPAIDRVWRSGSPTPIRGWNQLSK